MERVPVTERPNAVPTTAITVRPDGVAVVTLEARGPENLVSPGFVESLLDAVTSAGQRIEVRAVVLRSAKPDFAVGTDPRHVRAFRFAQDAEDFSRSVAQAFARLTRDRPVVAFVDGAALGAGLELALACSAIVASDDARTRLGLTELGRGLPPLAQGSVRVAQRAGLRFALDLVATGRTVRPLPALRAGLVDEVVPPFAGVDAACALARELADGRGRHRIVAARWIDRAVYERNPLGRRALFGRMRAALWERARGHDAAAERAIDVLERYARKGVRAAADLEPRLFGDSVVGEAAHRLLDLSFAEREVAADPGVEEAVKPAAIARIGVVGAGRVGGAVARISAEAGLDVRLKDTKRDVATRGLRDALDEEPAEPLGRRERESLFGRITRAGEYASLRDAALVVEAVSEDLALKRRVLGELEAIVGDGAVLATSTTSLSVAAIAAGARRPERVVGMRYAAPVAQRRLVEVVRPEAASPRAVATAVALARRQGKAAIVVRDRPLYFVPRLLLAFVLEALRALDDGAAVETIDAALVDWGFPVGPLRLLDTAGLAASEQVARAGAAAYGPRLAFPAAFTRLREDRRFGRKLGRGFYRSAGGVDPGVYRALGLTPRPNAVRADDLALRCGLAMVNEAIHAVGEGVVRSVRDADVGAVLGAGFPAFRGGPLRYVDGLGLPEVLRRIRSLEQRFGPRFAPAPLLVERARSGQRFY